MGAFGGHTERFFGFYRLVRYHGAESFTLWPHLQRHAVYDVNAWCEGMASLIPFQYFHSPDRLQFSLSLAVPCRMFSVLDYRRA